MGEKAGLHDGVDPAPIPVPWATLLSVDDVEMAAFLSMICCCTTPVVSLFPDLLRAVGAVEQEGRARERRIFSMS